MNRISQYEEERSDSDLEGLFSDQDGKLPRKKIESLFSSIMEVRWPAIGNYASKYGQWHRHLAPWLLCK